MYSIAKPRIDQKSLKCRGNNCEFYGNAQWDYLCSKCFREKVLKERLAQGKIKLTQMAITSYSFVFITPASRSKIHQKGVPQQQTSSKHHPEGQHQHQQQHAPGPSSQSDEKKSKKRNILEVFKKTTSLTSKDSFKDSKKQHHQKHVERVMEPVAIAHLEMLKVTLSVNHFAS